MAHAGHTAFRSATQLRRASVLSAVVLLCLVTSAVPAVKDPCDQNVEAKREAGELGYQKRSDNRCEGYYDVKHAANDQLLSVKSLIYGWSSDTLHARDTLCIQVPAIPKDPQAYCTLTGCRRDEPAYIMHGWTSPETPFLWPMDVVLARGPGYCLLRDLEISSELQGTTGITYVPVWLKKSLESARVVLDSSLTVFIETTQTAARLDWRAVGPNNESLWGENISPERNDVIPIVLPPALRGSVELHVKLSFEPSGSHEEVFDLWLP